MLRKLLVIAILLVAVAVTASTAAASHDEPQAPRGALDVPLR